MGGAPGRQGDVGGLGVGVGLAIGLGVGVGVAVGLGEHTSFPPGGYMHACVAGDASYRVAFASESAASSSHSRCIVKRPPKLKAQKCNGTLPIGGGGGGDHTHILQLGDENRRPSKGKRILTSVIAMKIDCSSRAPPSFRRRPEPSPRLLDSGRRRSDDVKASHFHPLVRPSQGHSDSERSVTE